MSQYFQVLKCYKCFAFQVHQTKKSNKFECKLCGEKQSIKRHYGLGTGKECRLHVQKLNGMRGEIDELKVLDVDNTENKDVSNMQDKNEPLHGAKEGATKWSQYLNAEETIDLTTKPMYLGETEVVLEIPKNVTRKRKNTNASYSKKKTLSAIDSRCYAGNSKGTAEDIEAVQDSLTNNTSFSNKKAELQQNTAKLSKKSKWAEYASDFDDANTSLTEDNILNISQKSLNENTDIQHTSNTNDNLKLEYKDEEDRNAKNVFKIIPIDKNSKWAKYLNDIDNSQSIQISADSHIQDQGLFSLCDDGELDDVLDI